jgi:alanyl-tRNA synthetase
MTDRLYYTDAYLDAFDARVVEVSADGARVYLDRTAFYPTSGGQPHDTGTIAGQRVVDVVDEGARIAHLLADPASSALEPGREVEGRIDWARRFDQMQQHTGQHLLSAVTLARYGWRTVSVHFGEESATLDFEVDRIPGGGLAEIEAAANAEVTANRPIRVSFEEAATVTDLRRPSRRSGTLRIVTIDGLDRSACGGTHLAATGEIGAILLRKLDQVRGAVRLEFVCGGRAVRRSRADFDALSRIAGSLSASLDGAPGVVESQSRQLGEAITTRKRLRKALAEARAALLLSGTEPDAGGVRRVVVWAEEAGLGVEDLRDLALAFAASPGAVLVAATDQPPTLVVAAAPGSGVEAGRALKTALERVGGRGGGSATVAQGSAPSPATARAALDDVLRIIAPPNG